MESAIAVPDEQTTYYYITTTTTQKKKKKLRTFSKLFSPNYDWLVFIFIVLFTINMWIVNYTIDTSVNSTSWWLHNFYSENFSRSCELEEIVKLTNQILPVQHEFNVIRCDWCDGELKKNALQRARSVSRRSARTASRYSYVPFFALSTGISFAETVGLEAPGASLPATVDPREFFKPLARRSHLNLRTWAVYFQRSDIIKIMSSKDR